MSSADIYESLVVIFDEVVTFEIGDFLFEWPDSTVKIGGFREKIIDVFIDAYFKGVDDPEVKTASRGS